MAKRWIVHNKNLPIGFLTAQEVQDYLRSGRIDPFDFVSAENSNIKVRIIEADELFGAEERPRAEQFGSEKPEQRTSVSAAQSHLVEANQSTMILDTPQAFKLPELPAQLAGDEIKITKPLLIQRPRQFQALAAHSALLKKIQSRPAIRPASAKKYIVRISKTKFLGPVDSASILDLWNRGLVAKNARVELIADGLSVKMDKFIQALQPLEFASPHSQNSLSNLPLEIILVLITILLGFGFYILLSHGKKSPQPKPVTSTVQTPQIDRVSASPPQSPLTADTQPSNPKLPSDTQKELSSKLSPEKLLPDTQKLRSAIDSQQTPRDSQQTPRKNLKSKPRNINRLRQKPKQIDPPKTKNFPVAKANLNSKSPILMKPSITKIAAAETGVVGKSADQSRVSAKTAAETGVVGKSADQSRVSAKTITSAKSSTNPTTKLEPKVSPQPLISSASLFTYNPAAIERCNAKCRLPVLSAKGEEMMAVFFKVAYADAFRKKKGRAQIKGRIQNIDGLTQIIVEKVE